MQSSLGDAPKPRKFLADAAERTVLIVDDDQSVRSMLGFVFQDEGFQVHEAADGVQALDVLRQGAPDVMILDLMMPRVDGHGVLRARRDEALAPDCRIVILTAKSDPADSVWCWELGADEYFNTPVDPDRLFREVGALLRCTPEEIRVRRASGLAEAKRLDAMEAAFKPKRRLR